MIVTILICLYISCLCWTWGIIILDGIRKLTGSAWLPLPHFSITCIAGFSVITVIAAFLSLFIPLDGWIPQLIFLVPALLKLFSIRKRIRSLVNTKTSPGILPGILFLSCLLLITVTSTWKIVHPDTLAYHAQTIQWIEKFKAVPGLVHLHVRYGYQGLWFVSCALFSYRFTGLHGLTFINITLISWYLFFVTERINAAWNEKKVTGILWLALLITSLVSYTQVRLTVSSASPDFIAVILVWLAFYLLYSGNAVITKFLVIIISTLAITIKLSVLPVLLLLPVLFFSFVKTKRFTLLLSATMIVLIIIFPFVTRNIISSGYAIFPAGETGISNTEWRYNDSLTALEKDYITAYAKQPVEHNKESIERVLHMSPGEWIPQWWRNQSAGDKFILFIALLSLITGILKIRRIARYPDTHLLVFMISAAGLLFWFMQAPDPRFGFAFIIPVPAIVLTEFLEEKKIGPAMVFKSALGITLASVLIFSGYRFVKFFSVKQVIQPEGIVNASLPDINCNGNLFLKPGNDQFCGDNPVPCMYTNCDQFMLIGNKIEDGFKAAKNP